MKTEKPILFQAEMVRAILSGQKTQTRRIVKNNGGLPDFRGGQGDWDDPDCWGWECGEIGQHIHMTHQDNGDFGCCPYWAGLELWVRETWGTRYSYPFPPSQLDSKTPIFYKADNENETVDRWTPSIFMPRWASRIQLKITDVKVERLHDISEIDACDEGAGAWAENPKNRPKWADGSLNKYNNHKQAFEALWRSINKDKVRVKSADNKTVLVDNPARWDANPWLWCITFERIKP